MRRVVLGLGFAACLALAWAPRPRLLWNTTASIPVGFYGLSRPGHVQAGDLVVVQPDPALTIFLADGGWLPRGVPLIKPVAAVVGQSICRSGQDLTIDDRPVAHALATDGHGRALPAWSGCRTLAPSEVFLLAPAPGSVDGRYFGLTDRRNILARAKPLWTFEQEPVR